MYEAHYINYSVMNFGFIFCSSALSFRSVCGMIKVENTSLNFIAVLAGLQHSRALVRPGILYLWNLLWYMVK
jgi:hypothetical protein